MIKVYPYIALLIFLINCQETVFLELDSAPPRLVIEGKITDQPGPYTVQLSYSSTFNTTGVAPELSEAEVVVSDDRGNEETLVRTGAGTYQTVALQGQIGTTYTLEVTYEGTSYAATSYLGPVGGIDSLVINYSDESSIREEGYYVSIYAQKSVPDQLNYYRWKLYENDSLLNGRQYLIVDSDEFAATIEGIEFDYAFDLGDTVKCETESLTKEAFDYFVQLNTILNRDGVVMKSRNINPPTNFTPEVLGIFQTSAVSSAEAVIED